MPSPTPISAANSDGIRVCRSDSLSQQEGHETLGQGLPARPDLPRTLPVSFSVPSGCALAALVLVLGAGCRTPEPAKPLAPDVPAKEPATTPMMPIPGGRYERGDGSEEGYVDERPKHPCMVEPFLMDRTEITWAQWEEVFAWALMNGYEFGSEYGFHPERSREHPVCGVSWYDAVKWCNARSEREGLVPVYWVDLEQTQVYRAGQVDLTAGMVRWEADGYRLPTEAEWEWAARGGLAQQHFPWPSPGTNFVRYLDGSEANYWGSDDPWESEADCATSPVGYFASQAAMAGHMGGHGYGLVDIIGNVAEWCWDWYLEDWYADAGSREPNSRGPTWGHGRVLRGGSWISQPKYCRVAARYMSAPDFRCHCYGLRCVRSLNP